ncbi:Fic family protein [Aestuariivirga sp.]|uniref:Fic family protein n=1 Tax=Aestuariivirga sp. TaxID=2650926 RepID=UPI0039E5A200
MGATTSVPLKTLNAKWRKGLRHGPHCSRHQQPSTCTRRCRILEELNAIHPFRQGNGRSQFFPCLLLEHRLGTRPVLGSSEADGLFNLHG